MYDDLLGKKKKEKKKKKLQLEKSNIIDIGFCGQCKLAINSKIHRRSQNLYCPEIKKYVHSTQAGCLLFKRTNGHKITLATK